MLKVDGAYKHGWYENIESLRRVSNVEVFATQDAQPAGQAKRADCVDSHVTHMDQKERNKTKQTNKRTSKQTNTLRKRASLKTFKAVRGHARVTRAAAHNYA